MDESLRELDFGPVGMWWEITSTTAESGGASFEAINVVGPNFAGPPLHIHPSAEEVYEVLAGSLEVCVGGEWRTLGPGELATVPAGVPHTLRNSSSGEVRLHNVHRPAMRFEPFFRRLHALANDGVGLPPRDFRSMVLISMLFCAYPDEIRSVKPPNAMMKLLSGVGKVLGYRLPLIESEGNGSRD